MDRFLEELKVDSSLLSVLTKISTGMDNVDPDTSVFKPSQEPKEEFLTFVKLFRETHLNNKPPQPKDERVEITRWKIPKAFSAGSAV